MKDSWDRIELRQGDITKVRCDAIVNAANSTLLGGGGVDGAIHRAAGPELLAECRTLGGCPTGQARLTRGYNLPASYVIHTVGPVYLDGQHGEPELLSGCYESSMRLALGHKIRTIAFPAISCGVYGYPMEEAARIALATTTAFLAEHEEIDQVIFVLFSEEAFATFRQTYEELRAQT